MLQPFDCELSKLFLLFHSLKLTLLLCFTAGTSGQDTAGADDKDQVAKQPEIVAIEGLQDEQITSLLR